MAPQAKILHFLFSKQKFIVILLAPQGKFVFIEKNFNFYPLPKKTITEKCLKKVPENYLENKKNLDHFFRRNKISRTLGELKSFPLVSYT